MNTIVLIGSQSGSWVIRQHLASQLGIHVVGVDLLGKGAEVEADLSSSAGCQAAVDQVLVHARTGLSGVIANTGVDLNNPTLTFRSRPSACLLHRNQAFCLMRLRSCSPIWPPCPKMPIG